MGTGIVSVRVAASGNLKGLNFLMVSSRNISIRSVAESSVGISIAVAVIFKGKFDLFNSTQLNSIRLISNAMMNVIRYPMIRSSAHSCKVLCTR